MSDRQVNALDPVHERVGVVVVHGIGEQRRFEHLDSQVRSIVQALMARHCGGLTSDVTVEVVAGSAAPFHSEQDTWSTDHASIRVAVRDAETGKRVDIFFHEVWWADVNEPYSLSKQFRFWWWGLVVAFIPMKLHSTLASGQFSRDPIAPGGATNLQRAWVRMRLFGISFIAVLGAMSVGLLTFLGKRLLNLDPPNIIKIFVNYVSGVKLYNQKRRYGGGLPAQPYDYLDSMLEPPRVSVRRRMVRTIGQAALAKYDRWYLVAHSLGTIAAFNGLMESAYVWPGYFDEDGWQKLVSNGFAGRARSGWVPPIGRTSPRRPVWCPSDDVAYRSKIFERLHGIVMMGSPLEKFATLWPGRVPISTEPAFRPGTTWVSVYDPLDPVSGILRAFNSANPRCSPEPETIGYAADWKLLVSHIRYLTWTSGGGTLADGLAEWLVTGSRARIGADLGGRWFDHQNGMSERHKSRSRAAWLWWIAAVLMLTILGALALPVLSAALLGAVIPVWRFLASYFAS